MVEGHKKPAGYQTLFDTDLGPDHQTVPVFIKGVSVSTQKPRSRATSSDDAVMMLTAIMKTTFPSCSRQHSFLQRTPLNDVRQHKKP